MLGRKQRKNVALAPAFAQEYGVNGADEDATHAQATEKQASRGNNCLQHWLKDCDPEADGRERHRGHDYKLKGGFYRHLKK